MCEQRGRRWIDKVLEMIKFFSEREGALVTEATALLEELRTQLKQRVAGRQLGRSPRSPR